METVRSRAQSLEALGYDGLVTTEIDHDPFLPLTLAADATRETELRTGIAVAFARSPMTLANMGHDLNAFSKGRFTLGLGSQIKPHITKRFSMPWSAPAARMHELVQALHAIWDNWYEGVPLDFRGRFYEHSLMTPGFMPKNTQFGRPRVVLAAVGPKMNETAAAIADGVIVHPFNTEKYLRQVILPSIETTLEAHGRQRREFEIAYPPMIVTGETEEAFDKAKADMRRRISFYGSTPAYKGVLDIEGWGDLQPELNLLSKNGRWDAMANLIDDSMLAAFAVVGEPDQIVPQLKARYGELVDRMKVNLDDLADKRRSDMVAQLKAA